MSLKMYTFNLFRLFTFLSLLLAGLGSMTQPSYEHVKQFYELNELHASSYYPWISADGYRLYYTAGANQGIKKLYMATRPFGYGHFGNVHPLDVNIPDVYNLSCWLTNDELNIFFIGDGALMYSSRQDMNEPFDKAEAVEFTDQFLGYVSGPSLTQDLSQLFLYNEVDYGSRIMYVLILNRLDHLLYEITDTLEVPADLNPDIGQLSKDGLEYYIGMEENTSWNERYIYYYKRDSLNGLLSGPTKLDGSIQSMISPNCYPTITASKDSIIYVRSYSIHPWLPDYELHLATRVDSSTYIHSPLEIKNIKLKVYPNPASEIVYFSYELPERSGAYYMVIYSAEGKIIVKNTLKEGCNSISIPLISFKAGIYFCLITGPEVVSRVEKFIVN